MQLCPRLELGHGKSRCITRPCAPAGQAGQAARHCPTGRRGERPESMVLAASSRPDPRQGTNPARPGPRGWLPGLGLDRTSHCLGLCPGHWQLAGPGRLIQTGFVVDSEFQAARPVFDVNRGCGRSARREPRRCGRALAAVCGPLRDAQTGAAQSGCRVEVRAPWHIRPAIRIHEKASRPMHHSVPVCVRTGEVMIHALVRLLYCRAGLACAGMQWPTLHGTQAIMPQGRIDIMPKERAHRTHRAWEARMVQPPHLQCLLRFLGALTRTHTRAHQFWG